MELFPFDADYLRRLREDDPTTEEHFAGYFSALLTIKLRARGLNRGAIHEVTQETFFRVIRALRSPRGIENGDRLGAFVNSVCNNILHEKYREDLRSEPLDDKYAERAPSSIDIEEEYVSGEEAVKVHEILDHLPAKDARILRALFIEERPKNDVCAEMDVDRDYLRVLLHRAKKQFRRLYLQKIDDDGDTPPDGSE